MVFTDIHLQNFRSYKDASFELSGGVTIVVGPNAAGKSNLIEAMLLLSNGVSYRGKTDLIRHGSEWSRLDVHTDKNLSRAVKLSRLEGKDMPTAEFVINDKNYKRLPYSQKQPAVLFEPNNLFLMHGEPQSRREYLDGLSSGLNDGFSATLSRYKRALTQRNALLKSDYFDKNQLFVWNVRVVELADMIVGRRLETLELISKKLSTTYSKISSKDSSLEITYKSPLNTKNYSASLLSNLEKNIDLDRARGFTGNGPHREDFTVVLNNEPVSTTASRGEIRTLMLALKIIELELYEEKVNNRPVLLLDDVFSELDGTRRKALTKFLRKYQTIITTTDADIILKNFSQDCQIIPLS